MAEKLILNKSFLYLFPTIYTSVIKELGLEFTIFLDRKYMLTLINSYCFVELGHNFAIKFTNTDVTEEIIKTFSPSKYYVTADITDTTTTLIFNIPPNCVDCYNKFITGKYSKYSKEDKEIIINFVNTMLVSTTVHESVKLLDSVKQVLNKSEIRAKMLIDMLGLSESDWNPEWEVSSIIDVDKENYILQS